VQTPLPASVLLWLRWPGERLLDELDACVEEAVAAPRAVADEACGHLNRLEDLRKPIRRQVVT